VYRDKGVNKHEILKVSKKVDDLSPQFLMAFSNNETFNEVLIDFANEDRSRNGTDKLAVFMSITLTGRVLISDFKQNGNSETISFSYTKMTVTEPTAAH
jgi:type VI protein secretion system component Hcp